jgi:hypothetical protein
MGWERGVRLNERAKRRKEASRWDGGGVISQEARDGWERMTGLDSSTNEMVSSYLEGAAFPAASRCFILSLWFAGKDENGGVGLLGGWARDRLRF